MPLSRRRRVYSVGLPSIGGRVLSSSGNIAFISAPERSTGVAVAILHYITVFSLGHAFFVVKGIRYNC